LKKGNNSLAASIPTLPGGAVKGGGKLQLFNILGYRSSVTIFQIKAHLITTCEGLETGRINGAVMYKYILTVFQLNEPISLLITEPFYCSLCQSTDLLSKIFYHSIKPQAATLAKETILQSKTNP